MKICFLSAAHPALDKRVFEKEIRSLHSAGFDVIHLCPQQPGDPMGRWEKDGVAIESYPSGRGIRARLKQLVDLYRKARVIRADVYHCNEVDSWLIGVLLRLTTGARCVFDVHEHYPSTFAELRFPPWARPFVSSAVRALYLLLVPFTYRIVLAKRSVAPDFWFAKKKVVLVQNFTPRTALTSETAEGAAALGSDGPPVLIHLGLIGIARGWPQLLDALAAMKRKDAVLHIVGTFHDGTEVAFFDRAKELGLTERIRFDRWMPFDKAFQCLLQAKLGLILFQPGIQNHIYALPHKMFDYMLADLPVVAPAFAAEVSDIVREADCGVLVDPTEPDEIAHEMDRLLDDENEHRRLGENGHAAVLDRYNWEQEAEKLVRMYEVIRPSSEHLGRQRA